MAHTYTSLDRDLARMIARFPKTFTWGAASYACTVEDLSSGRDNDLADGSLVMVDLRVHARTALFTTLPAAGETITVDGTTYRIDRATKSGDFGVELVLDCVEARGR